jgi:hypothetical protein
MYAAIVVEMWTTKRDMVDGEENNNENTSRWDKSGL